MRLISLIVFTAGLWPMPGLAGEHLPNCAMGPDHPEIRLPNHGLDWLPGADFSGHCDAVPVKKWIRSPCGSLDLLVSAGGPSGSGRYWSVTVGIAQKQHTEPIRGVCLITSTLGWRTLQRYKRTPLPWLDDLSHDGKSELILWDSFPIRADASSAEYGLIAWVYRLTSERSLSIDWDLSRQLAREIALAYRSPLDAPMAHLRLLRAAAAEALEQFADRRCRIVQNDIR